MQKRFLLPQFVVFSPALLWDENDIIGNWHVWSNCGGNSNGLHLVLHPLFMGRHSMLHSVWESNICFILRIEIRKVAKILKTDSLEDENSIVTSFLLSRHSMPPRGRPFSRFHGQKHFTLELKVLLFSEDGLSLKFVHRHLKLLIYFDV